MKNSVDSLLQNGGPDEGVVLVEDKQQVQSAGQVVTPDAKLNFKIRSLNEKQRKTIGLVYKWANWHVKIFL